jgi:hypothetical protein
MPASQVLEILGSIRSLGFHTSLRDAGDVDDHELASDNKMVVVSWEI